MNYQVDYEINGETKGEAFDAYDVGQAYAKCLKKYPTAKIIAGYVYRKCLGAEMWMTYEPASTARPEPLPKENRVQVEMELEDDRKPKGWRRH